MMEYYPADKINDMKFAGKWLMGLFESGKILRQTI